MTSTTPVRRPSVATRKFGYTLGAVVNVVLLYLVNVDPGWQAVPFLTGDTVRVLGLVNLSLVAGLVVDVVLTAYDPPWLKNAGDLLNAVIALAVVIRMWQVFPFDFPAAWIDWALVVRVVLGVSVVGTCIAVVVLLVTQIRRTGRTAGT